MIYSKCPKCNKNIVGVFPIQCPYCDFNINAVAGRGTTSFQKIKWKQHTDILHGRNIQLYGKTYNASFDYRGAAEIDNIVRYAITYGDKSTMPSSRVNCQNQVIIAYLPEPIGSGTALHYPGTVACSGVCLISPHSENWAHSFPVIDEWVQKKYKGIKSRCRKCGNTTEYGQPVCSHCYIQSGCDWESWLREIPG